MIEGIDQTRMMSTTQYIFLTILLVGYFAFFASIVIILNYRSYTALGVRDNDALGRYLCYHRVGDNQLPYWSLVFGGLFAPFRAILFLVFIVVGFLSGVAFGTLEWIRLHIKEAISSCFPTSHEAATHPSPLRNQDEIASFFGRCRVFSDMILFSLLLAIMGFSVDHYAVVPSKKKRTKRGPGSEEDVISSSASPLSPTRPSASDPPWGYLLPEGDVDPKGCDVRRLSYSEIYNARISGQMTRKGTILPNHISMWDSFVFAALSTSFVAVAAMVPSPVRFYGRMNQLILLDGTAPSHREATKKAIAAHQHQALVSPVTTAPLTIFPEGTSTTGRCLMPFKAGAFETLTPVQPVLMKYSVQEEPNAYDTWSLAVESVTHSFLLAMADWRFNKTIELMWLPTMHPRVDETPETFKERVYRKMNGVLSEFQPNCIAPLPVNDRFSIPHTHFVKNEARKYQYRLWYSRGFNAKPRKVPFLRSQSSIATIDRLLKADDSPEEIIPFISDK